MEILRWLTHYWGLVVYLLIYKVSELVRHVVASTFISVGQHGLTALHLATASDDSEIVQKLLNHPDIDPNIANKSGLTAIKLATIRGKTKALKVS